MRIIAFRGTSVSRQSDRYKGNMRYLVIMLASCLIAASASAEDSQYELDSNVAFFEGETRSYVIRAPRNFVMVTDEATDDGYSLAFVPAKETYATAAATVGVTYYKLTENEFTDVLDSDTAAMRNHYGPGLVMRPVDSVRNFVGEILTTFYLDDKSRFIPAVMAAYYDGGTEMLIFELNITEDGLPRFVAEGLFTECLTRFKVLRKGDPNAMDGEAAADST